MINIKIEKNKMLITGHADYKNSGKDIICAAVSTSIILTINLIEKFNELEKVNYRLDEGFFELNIKEETKVVRNIYENLEYTLCNLELQYPKYIKILK